ncbi:MAG: translation elongation factor 4 [Patescibacteria group bacterium]
MADNIRNFCIIAHIDHGKSTLADRLLELTKTVEQRKMREQYLDQMELERERGITIKLQPVTMRYALNAVPYTLNLIDTPGHIDFSYEVSRSLAAVEGAILLVDASQGVEAQTITNVELARSLGLVIIPVLNKIDLPHARTEESAKELVDLLHIKKEDILKISAKTGEGVPELLEEVVRRLPSPRVSQIQSPPRALIFDFEYSSHQGIIAYVRVSDGGIKKGDELKLYFADEKFTVGEVGIFTPALRPAPEILSGQIGYVVTNIKKPETVRVGDTIVSSKNPLPAFPGYKEPKPVVFSSIYPESQDDFEELRSAFFRLRLTDSAFSFEQEADAVLGRGFRSGFLGMLHMEIVVERIRREFGINLVVATPTVAYEITYRNGEVKLIYSPSDFPEEHEIAKVREPWIKFEVLTPQSALSGVLQLLQEHRAEVSVTSVFGERRMTVAGAMPIRELMRGFFDQLKSVSQGYASFNYEWSDMKEADVARLNILVADEPVSAFTKIVAKDQVEFEGRRMVEKLHEVLPRALFVIKIQAVARGRIIASRALSALKKDVAGYLYGGDRTRRMKLWAKQKRGKKKLKELGKVNIPHEVFVKMIKG